MTLQAKGFIIIKIVKEMYMVVMLGWFVLIAVIIGFCFLQYRLSLPYQKKLVKTCLWYGLIVFIITVLIVIPFVLLF